MHANYSEEAKASITECCLLAADIDKTLLHQSDAYEHDKFINDVAPTLRKSAELGAHIALVTGNSMDALCCRFLKMMIAGLEHNRLHLLDRFHFFCNSGGVYARIFTEKLVLPNGQMPNSNAVYSSVVGRDANGTSYIKPAHIDIEYTVKNSILDADLPVIEQVLKEIVEDYTKHVKSHLPTLAKKYKIDQPDRKKVSRFSKGKANILDVIVDKRYVKHLPVNGKTKSLIQITVRPIISFRHSRNENALPDGDLRTQYAKKIQDCLDARGLWKYAARSGGVSSIDITLAKLDKAYAITSLIDRLHIGGIERFRKKQGSNTLYFGDEVIVGGGNDYPVTKIPGILVFAVNDERNLIPFLSGVQVADPQFTGPDATERILTEFNKIAENALEAFAGDSAEQRKHTSRKGGMRGLKVPKTAVELYKAEFFLNRIKERLGGLSKSAISADDLNVLHTIVTIMSRKEVSGKKWVNLLINELDQIMELSAQHASNGIIDAIGASHQDSIFK